MTKSQTKEYKQKWYREHREISIIRAKANREKSPEKYAETARQYRHAHRQETNDTRRAWRKRNPSMRKAITEKIRHRYNKEWNEVFQSLGLDRYNTKCSECSIIGSICFHHEDQDTKDFDISRFIAHRPPTFEHITTVKVELEKCIVLCRQCHGKFHAVENGLGTEIQPLTRIIRG